MGVNIKNGQMQIM